MLQHARKMEAAARLKKGSTTSILTDGEPVDFATLPM